MPKVVIVGSGSVGTTLAYTLQITGVATEIVLIDSNHELALGQVMDMNHGLPFVPPVHIYAGGYPDCKEADVIVITAGARQKPEETRLDLVDRNAQICRSIVDSIIPYTSEALLLVVTNPVDIMTYVVVKHSGLPPRQVIGSGTVLDSARFRYLLGQHCNIDTHNVHAYVIGEHGDSEVPVWSLANIAGMRLADYCATNGYGCDQSKLDEIFLQTRDAAYHIIERKGFTYYAVAAGLNRIIEAILRDQSTVLSVSSLARDYYGIDDVYLSIPTVVSGKGVERQVRLQLSSQEMEGLQHSADVLKKTIRQIDLSVTS